jgi:biopolymer transport protein TolR
MAFDPGPSRSRAPLSTINVTPLVDVMLVLLIIFMVTASLGQQGINVNLPRAAAKPLEVTEDLITVSIDAQQQVWINKSPVALADLSATLKGLYAKRTNKAIFLKADRNLSYGDYVKVVSVIKASGVEQLGMITEAIQK